MPAAAGRSHLAETRAAAADAIASADVVGADVVVVLATGEHADGLEEALDVALTAHPTATVLGGVASGVLGVGEEHEQGPALVALAMRFGRDVESFHAQVDRGADDVPVVAGWPLADPDDLFLVLADPYGFPINPVLDAGGSVPEHAVAGGLISPAPGRTRLMTTMGVVDHGAVGLRLPGAARRAGGPGAVLSHGCRPVGEPLTVTRAEGNVLYELAGRPAAFVLAHLFRDGDESTRAALSSGVQLGIVQASSRDDFAVGDFLIRGIVRSDPDDGSLVVGDRLEAGQVIQFQVRDAGTARADLSRQLERVQATADDLEAALVFTCNGRGASLFGQAHHDVSLVEAALEVPTIGAFCNGEIGPVGRRSYAHGFTASIAMLSSSDGV